jgi:hypothetical protein
MENEIKEFRRQIEVLTLKSIILELQNKIMILEVENG